MAADELVPVTLQTPSSVGRGQLEETEAGLAKEGSSAGSPVTQYKDTWDTSWGRLGHLGQAVGVKGQEDEAGKGMVLSPSETQQIQRNFRGWNNEKCYCLLRASWVPELGLASLRVFPY